MKILDKRISASKVVMSVIGAVVVAVLSLFLSACFYTEEGSIQITEFLTRFSYFGNRFMEIFNFKYLATQKFIIIFLLLLVMYICVLLILLLRPSKYIRGKEYGSAEWGDIEEVNSKLYSREPEAKYRVYYTKEKIHKKFFRKLKEDKKKYIK